KGKRIGSTPTIRNLVIPPGKQNTIVRDRHGLLWNKGKRKGPYPTRDPSGSFPQQDPLRFRRQVQREQTLASSVILSPEISVNAEGMSAAELTPADPTLCVGPNHVIQMVNGPSGAYFQIFNKSGI